MLIAKFASATGLSRDTIRFYVRKGLLQPTVDARGTNRYQDFDATQVERALLIREAQALGFTLREIAALSAEYARGDLSIARQIELMRERVAAADEQAVRLARLRRYFADKLDWLLAGGHGEAPGFSVDDAGPRTGGGLCGTVLATQARGRPDPGPRRPLPSDPVPPALRR